MKEKDIGVYWLMLMLSQPEELRRVILEIIGQVTILRLYRKHEAYFTNNKKELMESTQSFINQDFSF